MNTWTENLLEMKLEFHVLEMIDSMVDRLICKLLVKLIREW